MATLLLLPHRKTLLAQWSRAIGGWFPGCELPGEELVDRIVEIMGARPGLHVVFADDLPDAEGVWEALQDGFGAELGDRIIDLRRNALRQAA